VSHLNFLIRSFALGALLASPAMAATISFVDPLAGVDDTTGWSTDGNVVHLATSSASLLGGAATVSGSQDGLANDLSHTLTRGLGVWDDPSGFPGAEGDEIDLLGGVERITIDFKGAPYAINSVEVRSLFGDNNTDYFGNPTGVPEHAIVEFFRNGVSIHTENLVGTDQLGTLDGVASMSYSTPFVVDRLEFYDPIVAPPQTDPNDPTAPLGPVDPNFYSDFAVAKLDVTAVPEPTTLSLLAVGSAFFLTRRRASGIAK
jgi:hypothetical protein